MVRLQNCQFKFVCQGHRVKFKVTGAKNQVCVLKTETGEYCQLISYVHNVVYTTILCSGSDGPRLDKKARLFILFADD